MAVKYPAVKDVLDGAHMRGIYGSACQHGTDDYCPGCAPELIVELSILRNGSRLLRIMPDGTMHFPDDQTDEDLLREFRANELRVIPEPPPRHEDGAAYREELRRYRAESAMEPGTDEWKRQHSW